MSKKMLKTATTGSSGLSRGGRINLLINLLIGTSFLLTAVSGIYFLFVPEGGFQGGTNPGWDPGFLLSRTSWDIVHTWSGVTMILAAIAHFIIHWGWITKVTTRMFTIPSARREPAATVKLS